MAILPRAAATSPPHPSSASSPRFSLKGSGTQAPPLGVQRDEPLSPSPDGARQLRPRSLLGECPRCTLHPKKTLFASSRILSPCLISLLEYHERKNFPFSVRYVPFSLKNWVFSGVSLYSPASSGNSHSGCPAFVAAALKSASSAEINCSVSADCEHAKGQQTNKRPRSESGAQPSSKACREKVRRDKLNERFLELGAVLDPGKTPKIDKCAILNDAIRVVTELRSEAEKLKDSNESLQEKINELKAEKNELRDEKQKLKAEKESLEQQIKFMNARQSLVPHPSVIPATAFATAQGQAVIPATAFAAAQGQAAGQKLMMPVIGYPGFPMWQFMPPSDVDTSDDPKSCPPVA